MSLQGKVALITGAYRGIGKAAALRLAAEGADIAILDMGAPETAADVLAELRGLGVKAEAYQCNVTDSEACKATVKAVTEDFGKIDILVNNAGITRDGVVLSMKDEAFESVIDVNLKGAFFMIRACYSGFVRRRSGRIINMASISGMMGNAGQANYSASKAGLIGLTKSVARELASRGVTCNAVAPGFIETDMTKNITEDNALRQSIPMGRMGKPEDVANTIAFLASDFAGYITGEVIRVDGGLAM